MKVFVVIPAYNEAEHISEVIKNIPEGVQEIIVVDDCSQDNTPDVVSAIKDERIKFIRHERNTGVGGAMITGYRYALTAGADIVVKIDGDGQMNPKEIWKLVAPIKNGHADYCKGFRFYSIPSLKKMPKIRLIGNIALSFLTKISTGYWNVFDPTSGYTAIHREALSRLSLDLLSQGYFFEIHTLIQLSRIRAVVYDIEISHKYGNEKSELSPLAVFFTFPTALLKALIKRILRAYFFIDFNAVSLFVLFGVPLFLFGVVYGLYHWIKNYTAGILTPTGTVMVAVVPLLLGFQLLLQAIVMDTNSMPKTPLQNQDKDF